MFRKRRNAGTQFLSLTQPQLSLLRLSAANILRDELFRSH
jgi:hypothetical protein